MNLLLALGLLLALQPPAAAPRYALRAGERIEYRRNVKPAVENATVFEELIQLYVLEVGPNESHVLAIRVRDDIPSSAVHFRVSDRGRFTLPDETRDRPDIINDLLDLFPTLAPALDNQDAWPGDPDLFGRVLRQRRSAVENASMQVRFVEEDPTGVADFVNDSAEGVYWLDTDAGLMTRRETTRHNGRQRRTTTTRIDLVGREPVEPAWLERRRAELERFTRTQLIEDGLLDELGTSPKRVDGTLRRLEHLWAEYLAQQPRDPASPLRRVADACQRRVAAISPALREHAALAAEWIGAPAAQWSLQNAAGETVTSEKARKGVTIECFWSAASTPSLRMFAVLERLRDAGLAEAPSIVCLNVDSDLAAARRAATLCAGGLPTVFSGPPMDGDLPAALPIVRILDESGRVRRVLVGWRASLIEAVRTVARGPR